MLANLDWAGLANFTAWGLFPVKAMTKSPVILRGVGFEVFSYLQQVLGIVQQEHAVPVQGVAAVYGKGSVSPFVLYFIPVGHMGLCRLESRLLLLIIPLLRF